MLSWKIMLRNKCSVVKKCSDEYAQIKKNAQVSMLTCKQNAQIRCSDMLRTHLSTNNHYAMTAAHYP